MYIKITKSPTSKNQQVYLIEGYRDKTGKVKHRIIKKYGLLAELQKDNPDILEELNLEAKTLTKSRQNEIVTIEIDLVNQVKKPEQLKNYGYFFLESIYGELKIDKFINKTAKQLNSSYDLNQALKLLVFSRILKPASKLETINNQNTYFDSFNVSLESAYRSLEVLSQINDDLQAMLHQEISKQYNRDCSIVFYDVTNYYFETEKSDDFRKKGFCKEGKKSPLVSMGLFIDTNGIPIGYHLFPGNTHDSQTLIPILDKFREKFKLGKITVTADKGLNSGENLRYLANNNDSYIVSQKIRGARKEFINEVLNEQGYQYNKENTFKIKTILKDRIVNNQVLKEKVVIFWSKNYQQRELHKRIILEQKIDDFIDNPHKYKASNRFGIKKYLKEHKIDSKTGEVTQEKTFLTFDQKKYEHDCSLDGYYAIITNELTLSAQEIISKYRGLSKIEESFRVMKTDLEARPVYVRNKERIKGHFLICYIALTISRILEHKLDHQHSVRKIQTALNTASCLPLERGIYALSKQDEVFKSICQKYNVSFDDKYMKLERIRKNKQLILKRQQK